jgi:hypothetical protein
MGDLHPDKYGYPIYNDVTTGGRNRNDGVPPESGYIKCKKCGFTMNKHRHPKGWGDGITYTTHHYDRGQPTHDNHSKYYTGWGDEAWSPTPWGGQVVYYGDPTVASGCPMCGTFNYD